MPGKLEKVYGPHAVRAILLKRPRAVKKLVIADGGDSHAKRYTRITENYLRLVETATAVEPRVLPWPDFFRATGLRKDDGHGGICAFVEPRPIYAEHDLGDLEAAKLAIALDQLSNPRNLGTILRSAAFFRADAVILHHHRSANITPEVVQIASGGTEFLKIYQVTNLVRALEKLKKIGYWVYGLDERGSEALSETKFDMKTVIVVGAEGQGLRQKTTKCCDVLVRIPGGREGIESLNAGVAASISLADITTSWHRCRDGGRTDAD